MKEGNFWSQDLLQAESTTCRAAADGAASRCLKPASVKLPEVLAVEKVGDVFGSSFSLFLPGSAHNLRPREEEEAMFQQQIQWLARQSQVQSLVVLGREGN